LRKIFFPVLALVIVLGLVVQPHPGFSSAQSDIDQALDKIKQQEAALQKKRDSAKKATATIKVQKDQEQKVMQDLMQTIDEQSAKLNDLNKQINDVTLTLGDTGDQLQEAEDKFGASDELLKTRLRLMYMNGSVSYMDVLFSATSFSDFLDRFVVLQSIVGQDKQIMQTNKEDRDVVANKKVQVETKLAQIKTLAAEAEAVKDKLSNQEQQKEVMIASLDKNLKENDDISDDAEKGIVALAQQRAELNKKKKDLQKTSFKYTGGKFGWPVPGRTTIGDGFGYRIDPIKNVRKLHKGIDIPAPKGTTIVAAESGTVLIASQVNGYGNTVVLDHGNGLWTWYGHIRDGGIKVSEGDTVKRGQKIAEVGSTGDSTGNHLHFEVRVNQEAVDPLPYLK
jgi:murein DD-endopeptidase MepM/ murein hydrolase activator NlpD